MKIKELFADPKRWTQHCHSRDINNNEMWWIGPMSYSYCLAGACYHLYPNIWPEIFKKIHAKIGHDVTIAQFNDSNDYNVIKKLVEELDI